MRQITVRYAGECRKCSKAIEVGQLAIYEKRVGLFCPETCEPKETEEIRSYRQEAADRRADRLEEWAEKRETKAAAQLNSYPEIRHDLAFNTQPGHIPFRARMIARDGRAFESLKVAEGFRARAEGLRHVRVKGDAARRDEAIRDQVRPTLTVGCLVKDAIFRIGTVKRINKKTATVQWESGGCFARDLIFLRLLGRHEDKPEDLDGRELTTESGRVKTIEGFEEDSQS